MGKSTGFAIVSDRGATALGPVSDEFRMNDGAGTSDVVTPTLDFTGAANDLKLTLNHRYNFDFVAGMTTAYSGGQVHISIDDGAT